MAQPLPPIGTPERLKSVYLHADLLRAIAYTNVLHLCSGDPERWINENVEAWNQQLSYAEIIIDNLIAVNYVARRGTTK